MASKIFLLLTLALAATSAPLNARQEPTTAPTTAPKAAKGSGFRSPKGAGGAPKASAGSSTAPKAAGSPETPKASTSSSDSGMTLGNLMGGGMTSSDIKNGNFDCKKAALIFARGTGEPGNMGYVVGPGLGSSLKKAMNGDVLLQGADYSTNFSGGGAKEMVTVVQTVMKKCPDTKIVLGGYSQGAMQVHQALASLGPDAAKIAAAVTFGDPYSNMGWGTGGIVGATMGLGSGKSSFNPANGAIFCSTGDVVCGITPNIGGSVPKAEGGAAPGGQIGGFGGGHISYAGDGSIPKAVTFIVSKVST